jgi:cytochrome c oxidase accessory protein FixG
MGQFADISTVEHDGKRKWMYPIISKGRWFYRRRSVALFLVAFLLVAPWTKIAGRQTILIDIFNSKFYFFGLTYFANEGIVVFGFLLFVFALILVLTALYGRVFCGWACPQTVFMEFVYRPIERLIEGAGIYQKRFHALPFSKRWPKKFLKLGIFALISFIIANTLVAYFSGAHHLPQMMADGPFEHWTAFVSMLILFVFIMFQFSWFREQICTFVCPYGRLQSILLDRHSKIVAYDEKRGEPRGKPSKVTGDCVDCKMCMKVCPTGIDIRQGLQLECVHCTQCIDACDAIMNKLDRPEGLIRYDTEASLAGHPKRFFRYRLGIYAAMLLLSTGILFGGGIARDPVGATIHREFSNQLFTKDASSMIINPLRVHLQNRKDEDLKVAILAKSPAGLEVLVPQGEIVLKPHEKQTVHFLMKIPVESFKGTTGKQKVELLLTGPNDFQKSLNTEIFGPKL